MHLINLDLLGFMVFDAASASLSVISWCIQHYWTNLPSTSGFSRRDAHPIFLNAKEGSHFAPGSINVIRVNFIGVVVLRGTFERSLKMTSVIYFEVS